LNSTLTPLVPTGPRITSDGPLPGYGQRFARLGHQPDDNVLGALRRPTRQIIAGLLKLCCSVVSLRCESVHNASPARSLGRG
jgi:hypothetical protein